MKKFACVAVFWLASVFCLLVIAVDGFFSGVYIANKLFGGYVATSIQTIERAQHLLLNWGLDEAKMLDWVILNIDSIALLLTALTLFAIAVVFFAYKTLNKYLSTQARSV